MCQECGVSCFRWFLIKRRVWRTFSINWMFSAEAEPAHHKRVKRHFHIYVEEEHSPPVHYMGVSWISQNFCNNQFVKFLSISNGSSPAKSRFLFYLDQWLSMVCFAVNTKLAEPFMHLCMIAIFWCPLSIELVNVIAFIQNVIVHLTTFESSFSTL